MPTRTDGWGKIIGDYAAGVMWEVGYSPGGWGQREDLVRRFCGEVCKECYTKVKMAVEAFTAVLTGAV